MSHASTSQILTAGAYTVQQAAILAEVPNVAKVRRWLFGTARHESAVHPYYGEGEGLVSFVDLAQIMAIRDIRRTRRVSLGKIRETIESARRYGVHFPFARKHQAFAFGNEVVIRLADGVTIGATGKVKDDQLIEAVAVHRDEDIGFDAKGLANSYTPLKADGRYILLRANVRFGAPVVMPCNYTVESLVSAVDSEGTVLRASRAFGVDPADVELALQYEQRLARAAA